MNSIVVQNLRCPLCAGGFTQTDASTGASLRCERGHSFDIARQGYVNLLHESDPHTGDTAAMVEARTEFLAGGHYGFVSNAVVEAAQSLCTQLTGAAPPLVADVGAGTGYYLSAVLDALPDFAGVALDVSKPALRRAAHAHPRAAGALCDVWRQLPLADGAARLILNVFAPRQGAEFQRVLSPDGALIVVTPTAAHLRVLIEALPLLAVDPNKDKAVAASLDDRFDQIGEKVYSQILQLTHTEVRNLVAMGPSAWHTDPATIAMRLAELPEVLTVTASVRVGSYRPRALIR
jgi:23S rRNA (guanine745-N1)-methyltransferase